MAPPKHGLGVLLIGPQNAEWVAPAALFLSQRGYPIAQLHSVSFVNFLMLSGGVAALVVDARLLDAGAAARIDVLRRTYGDLIVAVVGSSSGPDVKRALDGGGTVYLSWPFAPEKAELEHLFPDLRLAAPPPAGRRPPSVVFGGAPIDWPSGLPERVHGAGFHTEFVTSLSYVAASTCAVVVHARALTFDDIANLRRLHAHTPAPPLIVVGYTEVPQVMQDALKSLDPRFISRAQLQGLLLPTLRSLAGEVADAH